MLSRDYADSKILSINIGARVTGRYLIDCAVRAVLFFNLCFKVKQERKSLAKLTQSELQDIGLHPADVVGECGRSLLDVPEERWRRYAKANRCKSLAE